MGLAFDTTLHFMWFHQLPVIDNYSTFYILMTLNGSQINNMRTLACLWFVLHVSVNHEDVFNPGRNK